MEKDFPIIYIVMIVMIWIKISNDSYDMDKNEYDITKLFKIILNYVRLENENNIIIDDTEINLIKYFLK